MNRYELFHNIITRSDPGSMRSILSQTVDILLSAFDAELGGYFAPAHGGLRCLCARTASGADLERPDREIPVEFFQKVLTTGQPLGGALPKLAPGDDAMTTSSGGRLVRFAAVPAIAQKRVLGVCYLERRYQRPDFSKNEMLLLGELMGDLQQLLHRSYDFERQSHELDTVKSRMAMSQVHLISQHPSMLKLFRFIQKLAKVPSTVLIHGESGTGKELVARAIYELGTYEGPFISMNCGGIEANLMKSELFGYLKGSFTGAQRDRPGLFKKAQHGVLFMDEIGEMPMDMQVAMLRTLECGEILPVGADQPLQVNTRVVAATHRNLQDMVAEGSFRNDLYQRLRGLTLQVPNLRERRTDIPILCKHFLKKYNQKLDLHFKGFRPEAMDLLESLEYRSGNVRELEHMVERAMVFEDDEEYIGTEHLTGEDLALSGQATAAVAGTGTFEERMNHHAVSILQETIKACDNNKTKAMKRLGLSRSTFYDMLNRHGIQM